MRWNRVAIATAVLVALTFVVISPVLRSYLWTETAAAWTQAVAATIAIAVAIRVPFAIDRRARTRESDRDLVVGRDLAVRVMPALASFGGMIGRYVPEWHKVVRYVAGTNDKILLAQIEEDLGAIQALQAHDLSKLGPVAYWVQEVMQRAEELQRRARALNIEARTPGRADAFAEASDDLRNFVENLSSMATDARWRLHRRFFHRSVPPPAGALEDDE